MRARSVIGGPNLSSQKGFALIEAMIAILIFAIGILGAYKLQIHATQGNALANRVSTSTIWAGYMIEELLGRDYDDADLQDGGVEGEPGLDVMDETADGFMHIHDDGSKSKASAGALYSVYWNIAEGEATNDGSGPIMKDVKQIRFHVFRNGGIGEGLLYSHDYYKAKWPEAE